MCVPMTDFLLEKLSHDREILQACVREHKECPGLSSFRIFKFRLTSLMKGQKWVGKWSCKTSMFILKFISIKYLGWSTGFFL